MIRNISIYCSSSNSIADIYMEDAAKIGAILGAKGINVINGAGSKGLMRAVSDAALAAGGTVTGVIPRFMILNGWCHQGLSKIITVETMHERKQTMASMSDAAIALPGGYGTLEELLEIITWRQLGLYTNPVIILNTNNFYDPLLEMLNHAADEKFIKQEFRNVYQVADNPEEIFKFL